jgi:hypothetical protein
LFGGLLGVSQVDLGPGEAARFHFLVVAALAILIDERLFGSQIRALRPRNSRPKDEQAYKSKFLPHPHQGS